MTITAKELRDATARGEGPLAKAHDDEPVFLLRGQDNLAADLVDRWAIWVSNLIPSSGDTKLADKAAEAVAIAYQMRNWHIRKNPD